MKLATFDQIKVFLRFLIPTSAMIFAVSAWGLSWILWYLMILVAAIAISTYIRKKNGNNQLSLVCLVLPGGIISAIAMFFIVYGNPYSSLGDTIIGALIIPLIWLGITIVSLTHLNPNYVSTQGGS